ncbi:MAG: hypothetical protein PVH88_27610 [Ignavibacteria bacterium]
MHTYGYWYDDETVWIPEDNGWSPAVVQWYEDEKYISWAPLPCPVKQLKAESTQKLKKTR